MTLESLYKPSLSLLTDLYQLTMSYGYWKSGTHDKECVFNLFFRKHPFGGNYTVANGLEYAISFMNHFQFTDSDIQYLASLEGNDGSRLFHQDFLDYLKNMEFNCDVDAIAEGNFVFPNQPLIRIKGPIIQCQILETALLTLMNFHSLIATKASRMVEACGGDPVLEFGLRRAQGIDGGLSASRAAWLGGCAGTSNVLAGKLFGIPVKGTHAHSWIMSFDDEPTAFEAYAQAMPNNCVFLVDTYDTLEGVRHAARAGVRLKERGHKMLGIRLDSGDLADRSIQARQILYDAGLEDARIVASNDLDEHAILKIKEQGGKVCMWGVGTKLVTAYDQPALGGVYKLSAMRLPGQDWQYKLKLSNDLIKISNPGIQQVRRYSQNGEPIADLIYHEPAGVQSPPQLYFPDGRSMEISPSAQYEDLLKPIFRGGRPVWKNETLETARNRVIEMRRVFTQKVRSGYAVGLETQLMAMKQKLIEENRGRRQKKVQV